MNSVDEVSATIELPDVRTAESFGGLPGERIDDRSTSERTRNEEPAVVPVDRNRLSGRKNGIASPSAYDGREPFAETFLAAWDEPMPMRIAFAYAASWEDSPAVIGASELVVGVPPPRRNVMLERTGRVAVSAEPIACDPGSGPAGERVRKLVSDMAEYATGTDIAREKREADLLVDGSLGSGPSYQGHLLADFERVLKEGIGGFEDRLKAASASGGNITHRCMERMIHLWRNVLQRYAEAAEAEAGKCADPRRRELAAIAVDCRAVRNRPPQTLAQAVQLYWITFLLDGGDDAGRLDRLLWPFLQSDLAAGRIQADAAACLLTDLFFKLGRAGTWGLVLGGVTAEGTDAANPLTFFFLELARAFPNTHPAISLRVHRHTPASLWRLAVKTWQAGAGMPALLNDEALVPALTRLGVREEDARDYGVGGCVEIQIAGKGNFGGEDGQINLAKCLELALNDGKCLMTGRRLGPVTGDPAAFSCFEDVWTAYQCQVEWAAERIAGGCTVGQSVKARQGTKPMCSLLIDDCIGRGLTCEDGGALYGHGQILTMGLIVVADSLAVLKHLVFGDRSVTLPELIRALRADWEGYEALRKRITATAPRFGNGDVRADELAAAAARHLWSFLGGFRTHRGGPYTGLVLYFTRSVIFGRVTGATPDGRKAGEVLEDSIGPWPGRDRSGPTAMLRSAASVPQELAGGGVILNLKLDPEMLSSDSGQQAAINLAQSYFSLGGQHLQVSVVSNEDLEAAMRDPDSWGNLIVRVGGYSARFTTLDPALQRAIIARSTY